MRLNLLQWLERSVRSFSFGPVCVNQTASYSRITRIPGLTKPKGLYTFDRFEFFGNHLLFDGERDENRVVSPLSFHVVLSLLTAGSGGSTRRQLLSFFDVDSVDILNSFASEISDTILADGDPAVGPRVRCSNGLWLDQSLTLKPSFKQILDSDYRAALNPVDFQAKAPHVRQQLNCWAENETGGLVKDLIGEGSLDKSVKLVFTNALYFKGAWDKEARPPFIRYADTVCENFVNASFITAKKKEFGRPSGIKNVLLHPYKKQSEDKRTFVHRFSYPRMCTKHGLVTHFPETLKCNISSEMEASHVLRQLEVTLPFSGGELTEMLSCFDGQELYVFSIFQKSFMEINEQGTEAATATAAIVMSGYPPDLLPAHPKSIPFYIFPFYVERDEDQGFYMLKTEVAVFHLLDEHDW